MTFCYDGHTKDMPSLNYGALANVFNKYFGRTNACANQVDVVASPKGTEYNEWLEFSSALNAQMMLYLHPTIDEIQAGSYDAKGEEILKWASFNDVPVCKGLDILEERGYRDYIHLNECGQRQLANLWTDCFEFPKDTIPVRSINI